MEPNLSPNPASNPFAEPSTFSSYPLWIKGFGALIVAAVIASLITSFPYLVAKRQLTIAGRAAYKEDYKTAETVFSEILKNHPQSMEARLGYAKALFAQHTSDADAKALKALEGCRIDEIDWADLEKVMPEEYQERFKPVKNQSTKSMSKSDSTSSSNATSTSSTTSTSPSTSTSQESSEKEQNQ
ncbi:MAG: hypothetical protein JST89_17540 [Cyanobacteria bacterium SZAS-4]|nr:hypothetical protein [Cyanobacteria bacterium SZAS-4]